MRLPISTRRPGAARAGLFQRFEFPHAHVGGELRAFGDGAFGIGRARGERLLDYVPARFPAERVEASSRSPDGHAVDAHGRNAHAHRHALAFLAADADAFVELQIVAHHADVLHRFGTVADQRRVAHRPRELAVFDQIAFRRGEDEVAARDIDLAAAEIGAVKARAAPSG